MIDPVPRLPLPRVILRDLLVSIQVAPGCRVLDADNNGVLVPYLSYLGIEAERIDGSEATDHLPEHSFHLVIAHRRGVESLDSAGQAAGLLSSLRPGGVLVVVGRPGSPGLARQLPRFPGTARTWRRGRFELASLQIASRPRSRFEWHEFVEGSLPLSKAA